LREDGRAAPGRAATLASAAAPLPAARGGAGLWRRPAALAPAPDGPGGLGLGRRRPAVVLVGRRCGLGRGLLPGPRLGPLAGLGPVGPRPAAALRAPV